jgi:hypothetical protein
MLTLRPGPRPAKLDVDPDAARYVQDRLAGSVQGPTEALSVRWSTGACRVTDRNRTGAGEVLEPGADLYMLQVGDHEALVCYLLELRHDNGAVTEMSFPWES